VKTFVDVALYLFAGAVMWHSTTITSIENMKNALWSPP